MTRERRTLGLVMLGLTVATLLARWPWLDLPMISDEGGYRYVARFWDDTHQLYRDIPFDRPQGIFLIYKAIIQVFGSSVVAIRLAAAAWNALTTLVLFLFAREHTRSTPAAAGAALLFAIVSASSSIEGFTANAELFAVLPLTLAAWCSWRRRWLAAGLLAGIATIVKPIGLAGLVLGLAWKLVHDRRRPGLTALVGAYAGVLALSLAHVATISWSAFWAQQAQKASVVTFGHHVLLTPQALLAAASAWHAAPAWAGLAALAGLGLVHTDHATRRFGTLWVASSVFGVAMGGEWSSHYWTQVLPPLAWLAASAFAGVQRRERAARVIAATAMAIALFAERDVPLWFTDRLAASWTIYHRPGYLVEDDVASYIRQTTTPDDTMIVAFWEAGIQALAERQSSRPYLYFDQYVGSPNAYRALTETIARRTPAVVVWANEPPKAWASASQFQAVLDTADYRPERQFGSVVVYRRTPLHANH